MRVKRAAPFANGCAAFVRRGTVPAGRLLEIKEFLAGFQTPPDFPDVVQALQDHQQQWQSDQDDDKNNAQGRGEVRSHWDDCIVYTFILDIIGHAFY
jgi:hypothetical protein